jgi:hypothetical protein
VRKLVFCRNICNTIPWLGDLKPSISSAAEGYIFCCSIEEAKQKIPEFPTNIYPAHPNLSFNKKYESANIEFDKYRKSKVNYNYLRKPSKWSKEIDYRSDSSGTCSCCGKKLNRY